MKIIKIITLLILITATGLVSAAKAETVHPVSLPALAQKEFNGRDFKVGKVLARTTTYTRYYITYKSGALTISGIMNVPKSKGPWPLLILNHGYIDPAVYTNGRGLKREQDYLAKKGYVVVHPDYRNHAGSSKDPDSDLKLRLGYAEDVINLIAAIKIAKLPYVNPERVGMLGHSMGGGVTMNTLIAQPNLVAAAVLFAPVSSNYAENFERWTRKDSKRKKLSEKIIAAYGLPETNPEFWANVSAVNFFDRIQAPILIHHGTADKDVPLGWSKNTAASLKAAGKQVTLEIYPNEPHEFIKAWNKVMEKTVKFFDSRLKT